MKTKKTVDRSMDYFFREKQEGWDAARDEGLVAESPYKIGTPEHAAWLRSWADGCALFGQFLKL